jgi:hypothetical protein
VSANVPATSPAGAQLRYAEYLDDQVAHSQQERECLGAHGAGVQAGQAAQPRNRVQRQCRRGRGNQRQVHPQQPPPRVMTAQMCQFVRDDRAQLRVGEGGSQRRCEDDRPTSDARNRERVSELGPPGPTRLPPTAASTSTVANVLLL